MTELWHELLAGADRPRPLPPTLRQRLEQELSSAGAEPGAQAEAPVETRGPAEQPIPAPVRDRLEAALGTASAERGPSRRWGRNAFATAIVGVAAALAALTLVTSSPNNNTGLKALSPLSAQKLAIGGKPARGSAASSVGATRTVSTPTKAVRAAPVQEPRSTKSISTAAPSTTASRYGVPQTSTAIYTPALGPGAGGAPASGPASHASTQNGSTVSVGAYELVPASGPSAGGNLVDLQAPNAAKVRAVFFGAQKASIVRREGTTAVVVRAPAHRPGWAQVWAEIAGQRPKLHVQAYKYTKR